ncbi:MAG TPA: cupin domain-containing protein [Methylomirabilota bacterium]|jgi:quercetin dioxygenase-like cupin family protein|nr:cupin domain-containing protein [Methylomirabilota bacterium]
MRSPALVSVAVVAFAVGVLVGRAGGQARPRMWADRVLDVVTDELPRKGHVVASVDHWEPGAETGRHRHPGPTVMVVLEGELEETREGRTRTLRAGQGVWHDARTEHNVRNPGTRPARALAVHLDPAG